MDFIRKEKSQDNYDPNTRHCLYGLDADLVSYGFLTALRLPLRRGYDDDVMHAVFLLTLRCMATWSFYSEM